MYNTDFQITSYSAFFLGNTTVAVISNPAPSKAAVPIATSFEPASGKFSSPLFGSAEELLASVFDEDDVVLELDVSELALGVEELCFVELEDELPKS